MTLNYAFLISEVIYISIPTLKKFREELRIGDLKSEELQKKVEKHCPRGTSFGVSRLILKSINV